MITKEDVINKIKALSKNEIKLWELRDWIDDNDSFDFKELEKLPELFHDIHLKFCEYDRQSLDNHYWCDEKRLKEIIIGLLNENKI